MQSKVHPRYKTKYRVANWPAYNQALVRRGDVTVWVSSEAIAAWTPGRSGRRGGQRRYSDLAIETALTLRLLYHLPLRQAEGFLHALFGMMRLDLSAPDSTTLSRRSQHLRRRLRRVPPGEGLHLVLDSTGLSIVGAGEWAAAKHGGRGRRGWRKLHLGVDQSGVIRVHTSCARQRRSDVRRHATLPQVWIQPENWEFETHRLWGAERIRGELLKLGIRVSKRTVQKYMRSVRPRGQHGQTWGTFLRNHTHDIWACDFLQLYDAWFRPIYAFFIVAHGTREVVHVNVTRSPTDAWVAQQLREATPYDSARRFLIRDNDGKFGRDFAAAATSADIDVVPIPPRSPNLNAICERFLGGLRRECLDHVLLLGEDHLRRVLAEWVGHFNGGRPHQGIGQRIPNQRQRPGRVEPCRRIVAFPVLGGLHHDYRRAA